MKFYKEFSIETKEYAKKIKELLKTPQEEFGTMNIGWIAIKQEIESIANLHNRMADEITYKVITPIETQLKDTSRAKRKVCSSLLLLYISLLMFITDIITKYLRTYFKF